MDKFNLNNPYDASRGGAKAIIRTVFISKPNKGRPYESTKPERVIIRHK